MANGYCAPILQHIEAVTLMNPAKKVSPPGFLQAILANQDDSVRAAVNEQYAEGHVRNVSVAYRERVLESAVSDTIDCDTSATPAKKEFTYPGLLTKSVNFYVPNSLIRQYCADSSQYVTIDKNSGNAVMSKQTMVMKEVYDMLIEYANALLGAIDTSLVTAMATKFGNNFTTGDANAKPISFAIGSNTMSDAFITLLADLRNNEFCNDVFMVGNGPFANLDLIRQWFSSGVADNGVNKALMLNSFPETFFDKKTKDIWGENQIGVFEKGSLALLSFDQYIGNFARPLGNSDFFNMMLPVNEFNCPLDNLSNLSIDVQVREIDCPTPMTVNGVNTTVREGVQIILSKQFQLFARPANLYNAADPMAGTNGTLRYAVTSAA